MGRWSIYLKIQFSGAISRGLLEKVARRTRFYLEKLQMIFLEKLLDNTGKFSGVEIGGGQDKFTDSFLKNVSLGN